MESDNFKEVPVTDEHLVRALKESWQSDELDGVWSRHTQAIATEFGTSKLDVNRWWCLVPFNWECSGCGRSKKEIAKVNQHGELMCHLVEHHDHMDRLLEKLFTKRIGEISELKATLNSERFAKRSAGAISAFDPTIICEDCNNIDAKAKLRVGAPADFSFTAQDIRKFVVARANTSHEIVIELLNVVWKKRQAQLQKRMELAQKIADLAATNEQWYEEADRLHHAEEVERHAKIRLGAIASTLGRINLGQFEYVSAPYPQRNKNLKGWRTNKKLCASEPPTSSEIQWVNIKFANMLADIPEDWSCPWCQRSRVEILRPSKKFSWSLAIHKTWVWNYEKSRRVQIPLCQDCIEVRLHLGKEAGVELDVVQRRDIVSVISAKPHSQHRIQDDLHVDQVVGELRNRYKERSERQQL